VISELAELTGQSPRNIRYYLQQGVLSRPTFHGTATRYGREHLLRLLGIEHLKREGLRKLSTIKQRLDAAGERELLAAVAARPPSAAVLAALGLAPANVTRASDGPCAQAASADHGAGARNGTASAGEPWRRFQLLPGLELLLAESAGPAVREIALRIQAHCAGPASVAPELAHAAQSSSL
jgi:DNA-binding transcriptional MerR regulator